MEHSTLSHSEASRDGRNYAINLNEIKASRPSRTSGKIWRNEKPVRLFNIYMQLVTADSVSKIESSKASKVAGGLLAVTGILGVIILAGYVLAKPSKRSFTFGSYCK